MRSRSGNLGQLGARQSSDATECERLSKRLYELTAAWEPAHARHAELRRLLVDERPSSRDECEARLDELLELTVQLRELERSLAWIDKRRNYVLERLFERQNG